MSSKRNMLEEDLLRYNKKDCVGKVELVKLLMDTLLNTKSFRNIYYLRCGYLAYPLRWILSPVPNVELSRHNLGGVVLIHDFSVVINPLVKIGRNCTILHNATIGDVKGGVPTIGDNVSIGAGAIITGGIHIGNNVKIGAGAIVVEDVPDGATVINDKAHIVI